MDRGLVVHFGFAHALDVAMQVLDAATALHLGGQGKGGVAQRMSGGIEKVETRIGEG